MKFSKAFLLGIVVVLAVQPFPLSAKINIDELTEEIRKTQTAAEMKIKKPVVEQEWGSYLRKCTGKGLRKLGDFLRTPEYKSAASQAKKMAETVLSDTFKEKTGIPIKGSTILNYFGNGLRTLGQKVKGGQPYPKTTRVILDNISLNKHSSEDQVREALIGVAEAVLKARESTAPEDFNLVVDGMVKRAYATTDQLDEINPTALYIEVLANKKLRENNLKPTTSLTRQQPSVVEKPLTGQQPSVVEKPLAATQLVALKKPSAETQSVAVKKPLVETQPPTAIKKPLTKRQPVAVKRPLTKRQPVKTKKPLIAQGPAAIKKPLTRQPQSAIKRPLTKQRPSALKKPLTKQRPAALKKPFTKQRPSVRRPRR